MAWMPRERNRDAVARVAVRTIAAVARVAVRTIAPAEMLYVLIFMLVSVLGAGVLVYFAMRGQR